MIILTKMLWSSACQSNMKLIVFLLGDFYLRLVSPLLRLSSLRCVGTSLVLFHHILCELLQVSSHKSERLLNWPLCQTEPWSVLVMKTIIVKLPCRPVCINRYSVCIIWYLRHRFTIYIYIKMYTYKYVYVRKNIYLWLWIWYKVRLWQRLNWMTDIKL